MHAATRERAHSIDGLRVLVVDDPSGAEIILDFLVDAGCSVTVAHTAAEALAILPSVATDVVIVNLLLPGMSGLLLTRTIKGTPATSGLTVIALSAVNGRAVTRVAREAGCAACIRTPVDLRLFARTLARCAKPRPVP